MRKKCERLISHANGRGKPFKINPRVSEKKLATAPFLWGLKGSYYE